MFREPLLLSAERCGSVVPRKGQPTARPPGPASCGQRRPPIAWSYKMLAARIHRFGSPEVIVVEDVPRPVPAMGEVLVRVAASGVAPWDALIGEGRGKGSPQPPLTLGSDFAGVAEAVRS